MRNRRTIFEIVFAVVFLCLGGLTIYLYRENVSLRDEVKNSKIESGQLDEEEIKHVLELLSKHMALPDETPLIYVVSDPQEAISAYGSFFNSAAKGDYLIVYTDKAIIYRESDDLIINSGPVVFMNKSETNFDTE